MWNPLKSSGAFWNHLEPCSIPWIHLKFLDKTPGTNPLQQQKTKETNEHLTSLARTIGKPRNQKYITDSILPFAESKISRSPDSQIRRFPNSRIPILPDSHVRRFPDSMCRFPGSHVTRFADSQILAFEDSPIPFFHCS